MIVATTQFSLEKISSTNSFWERINHICKQANKNGAKFILFPEYFSLSLILHEGVGNFYERILHWEGELDFVSKLQIISEKFSLCIISGTVPHATRNKIYNRCWIIRPFKKPIFQDKINMTRFEKEEWNIAGGKPLVQLFQHEGITCAVAICYDIEFPSYSAHLLNAQIVFVPSCTDDEYGYWRVRHCAEARAIENQAYVVMSSIVSGNLDYIEISNHYGKGAILTPCDIGFPKDGLLSEGTNQEGITIGSVDRKKIFKIRTNGTVLNFKDNKKKKKFKVILSK